MPQFYLLEENLINTTCFEPHSLHSLQRYPDLSDHGICKGSSSGLWEEPVASYGTVTLELSSISRMLAFEIDKGALKG